MRYDPPFDFARRADGRRLAYQVVGEGGLDQVFLLGWPTHSLGPVDIRGLLGSTQAPVLVLHRTGDRAADVRASRYMAERIPGARFVELPGGDIGGIAVHLAARVMAAAGAGEILCSRTVKDLVAGSGSALDDRGTHSLKGVPDGWQLHAVEPAGR